VLDLGCGAGRHVIFFAREGSEVHGLDSSAEALRICRERLRAAGLRATLVHADMRRIPYPDGAFDAAIAIASIYHGTLEDMRRAIAELHRVLRPGGLALLEFKSKRSYRYGKGKEIEPGTFIPDTGEDAGIPHHYSDRGEVEKLLEGFRILEISHVERALFREVRSTGDHRQAPPDLGQVAGIRARGLAGRSWPILPAHQASALKTRETRSRKMALKRSTHATTLPQEKWESGGINS